MTDDMEQAESEIREIDSMLQKAGEVQDTIRQLRVMSIRQEADLRAKAELLERIEEDIEVYGTTDPAELREVADNYSIANGGAL